MDTSSVSLFFAQELGKKSDTGNQWLSTNTRWSKARENIAFIYIYRFDRQIEIRIIRLQLTYYDIS